MHRDFLPTSTTRSDGTRWGSSQKEGVEESSIEDGQYKSAYCERMLRRSDLLRDDCRLPSTVHPLRAYDSNAYMCMEQYWRSMPAHCFSPPTPISHLTALLPPSSSPHLIRTPSHPHQLHFDRTPSGTILDAPHLISDPGPGTILNNARSLSVPSQRQRIYTTLSGARGNAF